MSKKLLLDSLSRALLVVFAFALSIQAIPSTISYQGQLLNNAGEPVANGTYQAIFTIYDANVGGNSKWTETQSVSTNNGLFNVKLGAINPIADSVFDGDPRYLGIIINSDPELTPRTELQPVPYSYKAKDAEQLSGLDTSKFAQRESANTFTNQNVFYGGTHHHSPILLYDNSITSYRAGVARWTLEEGSTFGLRFRQQYDDSDTPRNRIVFEIGDDGSVYGLGGRFSNGSTDVSIIADTVGVYGELDGANRYAVYGKNNSIGCFGYLGGTNDGVYGKGYTGVRGENQNGFTSGSLGADIYGVLGISFSDLYYAGYFSGRSHFAGDVSIGIEQNNDVSLTVTQGEPLEAIKAINSSSGQAIAGYNSADGNEPWRTQGYLANNVYGVYGRYEQSPYSNFGIIGSDQYGVFGSGGEQDIAVYGQNIPTLNVGYIGSDSVAIYGMAGGSSNYAGFFAGKVYVASNLGLGTTTPSAQLDVTGSTPFVHINTTNTTAGMRFRKNNSNKWSMAWNEGSAYLYFYSYSGGGTTMVIRDADGYVGIGSATPSERLTVGGNICYTGSIGACSDFRFKTETGNLDDALRNVLKMRPIKYRWKQNDFPDRNFDDREHIGVIAQEIEKLYPQLVMTDKDGYKSVDYSRLTPILIEAIKQQQNQIDELRKTVQQLANASKADENDKQFSSK